MTTKMTHPTTTLTLIATAQFDEDGQGMWLEQPDAFADLTKDEAERKFLDLVEASVSYFTDRKIKFATRKKYADDEIEVKFANNTAEIYYGDIAKHIRLTFITLK